MSISQEIVYSKEVGRFEYMCDGVEIVDADRAIAAMQQHAVAFGSWLAAHWIINEQGLYFHIDRSKAYSSVNDRFTSFNMEELYRIYNAGFIYKESKWICETLDVFCLAMSLKYFLETKQI